MNGDSKLKLQRNGTTEGNLCAREQAQISGGQGHDARARVLGSPAGCRELYCNLALFPESESLGRSTFQDHDTRFQAEICGNLSFAFLHLLCTGWIAGRLGRKMTTIRRPARCQNAKHHVELAGYETLPVDSHIHACQDGPQLFVETVTTQ